MPAFIGGNRRIEETTTILDSRQVLRAINFFPEGTGITVRPGITIIAKIADYNKDVSFMPLAMKSVTIGGETLLLIVDYTGYVRVVFPRRMGIVYSMFRRYYDVSEQITVSTQTSVPNYVEIIEVGNFVYILSPVRSWAIRRDGMLKIEQPEIGKQTWLILDRVVVDALEATIKDLDGESLKLIRTGGTASYIKKGEFLFARMRSELGGRGAPSQVAEVPATDSYIVEVSGSLTKRFFARKPEFLYEQDACVRYYPVCYMTDKGAEQRISSRENGGYNSIRYLRVLKNIHAYGLLVKYSATGNTVRVTIACKQGETNALPIGAKVGLTLPRNWYDPVNNRTWIDGTVVANPSTLPNKINDLCCVTIEYDKSNGDLAWGPNGYFIPSVFNFDNETVVTDSDSNTCVNVLWQTIDGKKYLTAFVWWSSAVKNFEQQIFNSAVPMTTVLYALNNDMMFLPITFFPHSEVRDQANNGTFNGFYYITNLVPFNQYNTTIPTLYYYRNMALTTQEKSHVFTANMKSLYMSNGNLDGSEITVRWMEGDTEKSKVTTWFKDRWYFPQFVMYANHVNNENFPTFIPPLVVISDPHGVEADSGVRYATLQSYITAPSIESGYNLPTNISLWFEPRYYAENNDQVFYNPFVIVNEEGNPIIQNDVPGANGVNDLKGSIVMCYKKQTTNDGASSYDYGFYEIYKESMLDDDTPIKIGEELNDINLILNFNATRCQIEKPFYGDPPSGHNNYYYLAHFPVYLTNVGAIETPVANANSRSVGHFSSVAYYNGRFYFSSGNTIKITNEYLEWNEENTIVVGGNVRKLIPLHSVLFIFTDEGIYTLNSEGRIDRLSSIKADKCAVYGERLMFSDDSGKIYHTEFTPVPVSSQWKMTENPYIIKEEDTELIKDISEAWTIYDMAGLDDRVYVATNKGVWIYHWPTKSWWQQDYPYHVLRLVEWEKKIIALGGDYVDKIFYDVTKFKRIPIAVQGIE